MLNAESGGFEKDYKVLKLPMHLTLSLAHLAFLQFYNKTKLLLCKVGLKFGCGK